MKKFLNIHMMISVQFIIIALVIATAAWVTHTSKSAARTQIEKSIENQLVILHDLAEVTDRNGADAVVKEIITDCPNRGKFESLLERLGQLQYGDLMSAQQLFDSCGSFYAERKALMVSKLEREYQVLVADIELLKILSPNTNIEYSLDTWGFLVSLEIDRAHGLAEQVSIQEDIISALIRGDSMKSSTITELLSKAQSTSESLGVLDKQIDSVREELMK
jgi:hypothetical protein